ncbi:MULTISPECIES: hypothetical protein [Pseudomonas]|uniref:Uncharacterized protein n=1 Tax=Pseudomonas fluorescens TaxID=294 RepID=A0A162B2K2_PSEFL|nr:MULTISPECIES: hypothetical protein [Pseudomonas]KZN20716.1 hypothetical protein A1D17_04015 [Pseudomonas fluorescens]
MRVYRTGDSQLIFTRLNIAAASFAGTVFGFGMLMLTPDGTSGRIVAAILFFSTWCSLNFMRSALLYLREGEAAEKETMTLGVGPKPGQSKQPK